MQTLLSEPFKNSPEGNEADAILRSCVHCGFCTATCPTYQLLGDELDGPRGRIYLIKQMLEGNEVSAKTQLHLDRCLTCRSCETTCPSGVRYGRLLDIGRAIAEKKIGRPLVSRMLRRALRLVIPHPSRFGLLLRIGRLFQPMMPASIRRKIPPKRTADPWPASGHQRSMLVLAGCAQSAVAPNINVATARVLQHLGIDLIEDPRAGCCGALSHHLSAHEEALDYMRRNIDAWWPHIEAGAEAIVMTASGCGVMVREYGDLLRHDPEYADKAVRITELTRDISEILAELLSDDELGTRGRTYPRGKLAFHAPCTLQHGQKITGIVETLLSRAGFEICAVPDAHLCCGSAGTYSILQSRLSQQLLDNKIKSLEQGQPDVITTANIGCLMHLETRANVPVRHWIELLDEAMQ